MVTLAPETVSTATDSTKNLLTLKAFSGYTENRTEQKHTKSWQLKDVVAGLAEADQEDFATEAEVKAVFANYGYNYR